jgi:hypothetical protein
MKKLLGYKWKTPQTRKENVNNVLDIINPSIARPRPF